MPLCSHPLFVRLQDPAWVELTSHSPWGPDVQLDHTVLLSAERGYEETAIVGFFAG